MSKRRFVIVDRDGTILVMRPYLSDPNQVELLPGAAAGLRHMMEMGLGLVVVTNQSGISRGFIDLARLERIHRRMNELLTREGVRLDAIYFCPHHPDDGCACRKPAPQLAWRAAADLAFPLHDAVVIGDNVCDVELGQNIGATTILVRTGDGAQVEAGGLAQPDYVADDLTQAARIIQRSMSKSGTVDSLTTLSA